MNLPLRETNYTSSFAPPVFPSIYRPQRRLVTPLAGNFLIALLLPLFAQTKASKVLAAVFLVVIRLKLNPWRVVRGISDFTLPSSPRLVDELHCGGNLILNPARPVKFLLDRQLSYMLRSEPVSPCRFQPVVVESRFDHWSMASFSRISIGAGAQTHGLRVVPCYADQVLAMKVEVPMKSLSNNAPLKLEILHHLLSRFFPIHNDAVGRT